MNQKYTNHPKIMVNAVTHILGNSLQGSQVSNKNYWGFIAYSLLQLTAIITVVITAIIIAPALGIPAAVVIVSRLIAPPKLLQKGSQKLPKDHLET